MLGERGRRFRYEIGIRKGKGENEGLVGKGRVKERMEGKPE